MITYMEVFSSLVNKYHPDNSGWNYRGDIDTVKNLDGLSLEGGPELKFDISDVEAEKKRLQSEYDAQEYARNRQAEYPSIQECVHAILDDTLDALQAKRASVKTKYPKGG